MEPTGIIIVSIAAMSLVVAAVIVCVRIYARQRTQEMQSVAHEIGFDFRGDVWNRQPNAQKFGTELFEQGSCRRFANLMVGKMAGLDTGLFDYSYTISAGEHSSTYSQTVVAFTQELWLPRFELRPEGFLDRFGEIFLNRDINFDPFPEFSRRYFLRGPDEAGIRKLFSPVLVGFLEAQPVDEKWHIEGSVTTLIIYRSGKTVEGENIRPFLERTSAIAQAFFSSPENLSQPVR